MACFSSFFWSHRKEEGAVSTSTDNAPWFIRGVEPERITITSSPVISRRVFTPYKVHQQELACGNDPLSDFGYSIGGKSFQNNSNFGISVSSGNMSGLGSVRKCDFGTDFEFCDVISSVSDGQVAPTAPELSIAEAADVARSNIKLSVSDESDLSSINSETTSKRHRRTGVYEISSDSEKTSHDRYLVKQNAIREEQNELDDKLLKQIENLKIEKGNTSSENGGENLLVPPVSGYCSSTASAGSEDESDKMVCRLVRRCESSDSAIVHSDEETVTVRSNWGETREEIDELPYAYPVFSPYSPRRSIDHDNVPTKTLIEAQCVPFPLDRKQSDSFSETSDILTNDSRRQSCFTDDSEEISRYRYWRTPSVVVSDYSDDPVGLSLEDIEYIRSQQKDNSSSPESSLHSSCSNLFGSNPDTFRKVSDCSTCSFSGDDDSEYSREVSLFFLSYIQKISIWVDFSNKNL